MTLYYTLWAINIIATLVMVVIAYVGGINAERPFKKWILALLALGCLLEIYTQIDALPRASRWVEQAIFVAIAGQVQRICIKVPMILYVITTSRSVKAWLGLCRYKRKVSLLPRPSAGGWHLRDLKTSF